MPPSRARFVLGVSLLGLPVSEVASRRLRAAHPHPLELRAEPAMPRMLGFHEWGGGLNAMSLIYGYPHPRDVSRPLIEVMTCFSVVRCYQPSLEEALVRAERRDAAYARGDWEDLAGPFEPPIGLAPSVPVPASGITRQDRAVVIDDEQLVIPVVSYRHYAALRFRRDAKVVTAVARSGFPEVPSFHTLDDLGPYAAGFRRFMLSMLWRGM